MWVNSGLHRLGARVASFFSWATGSVQNTDRHPLMGWPWPGVGLQVMPSASANRHGAQLALQWPYLGPWSQHGLQVPASAASGLCKEALLSHQKTS